MPDIDDAISEAKDDEKRKEETAQAMKIAYALEHFTKKSPDILKNMSDVVSQLDPHKFASVLRAELKNASDEMKEKLSLFQPDGHKNLFLVIFVSVLCTCAEMARLNFAVTHW